jgi:sugar fermentation stimulation protein A
LKKEKKLHWHIDFLSQYAEIIKVIRFLSYTKDECKLSKRMESFADKIPIPGFGSSDCKCISHLYFFAENPMNCFPQTDCFFSSSPDK